MFPNDIKDKNSTLHLAKKKKKERNSRTNGIDERTSLFDDPSHHQCHIFWLAILR